MFLRTWILILKCNDGQWFNNNQFAGHIQNIIIMLTDATQKKQKILKEKLKDKLHYWFIYYI